MMPGTDTVKMWGSYVALQTYYPMDNAVHHMSGHGFLADIIFTL